MRAMVVDDDAMVRRLLRTILGSAGIEVVAEAADGDEVLEAVHRHRPQVLLIDMRMQRVGGVEAIRAVRRQPQPPGIIAMTSFDDDATILEAITAGAAGFLAKDVSPEEIVQAVRAVADGGSALSPRAAGVLVGHVRADTTAALRREASEAMSALTQREVAVARLVAAGYTNAQIAGELFIGEATVKTHLTSAMAKLGVDNRVQVALVVDRAGPPA